MTYAQVFDLIAEYCNSDGKTLPLFADGWSRWPAGANAHHVLTSLANQARFWESRKPSIHKLLTDAQTAVRNNM